MRSNIIAVLLVATLLITGLAGYPAAVSAAFQQPQELQATTITVDSTSDPDTSDSSTCLTHTPCTLRRAVIQARNLSAAQKPATISFNIPTSDPGYVASLQIWRIQFSGISSAANATLRYLNGDITIDGNTQPGGRTTGPKIILVGSGTGQNDGIKLGETATQNNNIIRGLGFQNFKVHIYVNSDSNTIEDNWFGLTNDGTLPYLRNNNPQDGSGSTGVAISDGSDFNTIQDNVFLGLDGVAAAIRGEGNYFGFNLVGTAADGTVPGKVSVPSQICTTVDWLGGGGISVEGVIYGGMNHQIVFNTFAGLRQEISGTSTQPDAIRVSGTYHLIGDNVIGLDVNEDVVGVCGRGIFLSSSPHDMMVRDNIIVNTGTSAISLNDPLFDEVTLRNNIIIKSSPWPQVIGNPVKEDAIQYGATLPSAYKAFKPAKVTSINGAVVSGTSGDGSPCPNCIIEVFLDDRDSITEALSSFGTVTANASGNWTITLPYALTPSHGIRTTSTTTAFGVISGMSANTTTKLSPIYGLPLKVYLPAVIK